MKKHLLSFAFFFFYYIGCIAQFTDVKNRHFIIAVDGAMPQYTHDLISDQVRDEVSNVLNTFHVSSNDYVSVVSYQIDLGAPKFNLFAFVPNDDNGIKDLWRTSNNNDAKLDYLGNWRSIIAVQHNRLVSKNKASFQSAAKPYIMRALKISNEEVGANETYLLMLTDEKVNGTDDNYKNEWDNISSALGANLYPYRKEVFNTISSVNKVFHYEPIELNKQDRIILSASFKEPFVLVGYKVLPKQIWPVQAFTDIPAQLPIERIRGGFSFDLDLKSHSEHYSVEKIELTFNKSKKKIETKGHKFHEVISSDDLSEGDSITVKIWAKYKDGIYNGFVINPYDEDYESSFTISQKVVVKDEAKVIGLLPLFELFWWWFPHNVRAAVILWDVIIALIFIILVSYFFYKFFNKITRRIPANSEIKINKINGNNNRPKK